MPPFVGRFKLGTLATFVELCLIVAVGQPHHQRRLKWARDCIVAQTNSRRLPPAASDRARTHTPVDPDPDVCATFAAQQRNGRATHDTGPNHCRWPMSSLVRP